MADISIYCVFCPVGGVFVSGRQELPSDARAFSLTSFEA